MAGYIPRRFLGPVRVLLLAAVVCGVLVYHTYYWTPSEGDDQYTKSFTSRIKSSAVSRLRPKTSSLSLPVKYVPTTVTLVVTETATETAVQTQYVTASAPPQPKKVKNPNIPVCRQLPGAQDVVVMVKTGATEVMARIPETLSSLSKCIPHLMIFSDLEQRISDFEIIDALDQVSDYYKETHEDFLLYKNIRTLYNQHQDLNILSGQKGWNLDKWKNIPMLHKAFKKYPNKKWYVTIDADTYLGWSNLLQLLETLDHNTPIYMGCVYGHGYTNFAQGGTGYLLSHAAVVEFEKLYDQEHIDKWEKETSGICCGDVMLSIAMLAADICVTGAWPMFQVNQPQSIDWNSVWCRPAVTWHHVHPYEIEALWQFEQRWLNSANNNVTDFSERTPYLYKDAFEYFVQPYLAEVKHNWDNLAEDWTLADPNEDIGKLGTHWDWQTDAERQAHWKRLKDVEKEARNSVEACQHACQVDDHCMQWVHKPKACILHRGIRLGHPVDAPDAKTWNTTSGWMVDRIAQFKSKEARCVPSFATDRFCNIKEYWEGKNRDIANDEAKQKKEREDAERKRLEAEEKKRQEEEDWKRRKEEEERKKKLAEQQAKIKEQQDKKWQEEQEKRKQLKVQEEAKLAEGRAEREAIRKQKELEEEKRSLHRGPSDDDEW